MSTASGVGDAWNPVLVKEVRAALRGRVFRVLFPIVVLGAVVVAIARLTDLDPEHNTDIGRRFVGPIYLTLCMTLLGIVPLSAYFSMGSEWEENTFDLLSISNLRPRHIVWGKLFSAGVEATLYFSAFAPVLVFAFLLRGVDLVALLTLLGLTYVASLAMSAVALALSSMARVRLARILVLCVVAAACFGVIVLAFDFMEYSVVRSYGRVGRFGWRETTTAMLLILGVLFLGTTIACERLSHPEENHSTGPRVLVTALYAVWLGVWASIAYAGRITADQVAEPIMVGLILVVFAHLFFVTEREHLTRRCARGVPKTKLWALLAAPFLPGGGRALFLFALHTGLALATMEWIRAWCPPASSAHATTYGSWHTARVGMFAAHFFVYLGLISWAAHKHTDRTQVRWLTRLAIPTVIFLVICAPPFAFYFSGRSVYPEFEHAGNPFLALSRGSMTVIEGRWVLTLLAVLVMLLNLGRLVNGLTEVFAAAKENRERVEAS